MVRFPIETITSGEAEAEEELEIIYQICEEMGFISKFIQDVI